MFCNIDGTSRHCFTWACQQQICEILQINGTSPERTGKVGQQDKTKQAVSGTEEILSFGEGGKDIKSSGIREENKRRKKISPSQF